MPETREVIIERFQFPPITEIQAGDSVVWTNNDPEDHTATSVIPGNFDTEIISPGEKADPITFNEVSDQSGFAYFCEVHPSMDGRIVVRAAEADGVYPENAWVAMAQIIAANWTYDMADDFDRALQTLSGDDLARVTEAWGRVTEWWKAQMGSAVPILNRSFLSGQSRDTLESLGRRLRREYTSLRPLVTRFPNPNHPGGGQSNDAFGKAITIFTASDSAREAYQRQIRYVVVVYRIELLQDAGQDVPDDLWQAYQNAKQNVSPDDYRILAEHQTTRLRTLFGMDQFDAAQFDEGIWRMTLDGEWDDPPFSVWHWLRWTDAFIGVARTGEVPDLIPGAP